MNRHYAKQGEVPRVGEIWRPIGEKTTVFSLYLVDITIIGVPVPREREIVSVWPGRTLGSLLPRYYGSESTLDYHKLGFTPARVGLAGCSGSWVTHLCVDNGKSELGGASGFVLDDKVMWMRWRLQASYGLSRELLDVPVESAMEGIRFSRALISVEATDTADSWRKTCACLDSSRTVLKQVPLRLQRTPVFLARSRSFLALLGLGHMIGVAMGAPARLSLFSFQEMFQAGD